MSVAIFLPTRKGSVRIPHKNTRSFGGLAGGLLELKLSQLIKIKEVDEIILSTNDEISCEIAGKFQNHCGKLKVIERPENLSTSETNLTDLIKYVPEITEAEHILWTHVTSPFCTEHHYEEMIANYFQNRKEGYDSLAGVHKFMNFLWDPEKADIINRRGEQKWPQTQDLKELYEINNSGFMAPRTTFMEGNRLGNRPFLFEMNKIASLDIDDREDFEIAEAVYGKIRQ